MIISIKENVTRITCVVVVICGLGIVVSNVSSLRAQVVPNNTVTSATIVNGSITGGDIAASAVSGLKIANNTITGDKIRTGAIQAKHLPAGSIAGVKIAPNTITGDKIRTGAIQPKHIPNGLITEIKLAEDDLNGTYTGRGTITEFGCVNPADDGTIGSIASITLNHVGSALSGTITIDGDTITLDGTAFGIGHFTGTFSDAVSSGDFHGKRTGDTIVINAQGEITVGDTCGNVATILARLN